MSRSGTTLLMAMISASSRFAITSEWRFLPSLLRPRPRGRPSTADETLDALSARLHAYGVVLDREAIVARLATTENATPADAIRFVMEAFAAMHGRQRWGDNAEQPARDAAARVRLPGCAFRTCHPRRSRGRRRESRCSVASAQPAVLGRVVAHCRGRARRDGARLGARYLEVRYEQLVAEPGPTLDRVLSFLGEPPADDPLAYVARMTQLRGSLPDTQRNLVKPPTTGLRPWRDTWSHRDRVDVEAIAGPLLDELGYARSVPRASALRRTLLLGWFCVPGRRQAAHEVGGPESAARACASAARRRDGAHVELDALGGEPPAPTAEHRQHAGRQHDRAPTTTATPSRHARVQRHQPSEHCHGCQRCVANEREPAVGTATAEPCGEPSERDLVRDDLGQPVRFWCVTTASGAKRNRPRDRAAIVSSVSSPPSRSSGNGPSSSQSERGTSRLQVAPCQSVSAGPVRMEVEELDEVLDGAGTTVGRAVENRTGDAEPSCAGADECSQPTRCDERVGVGEHEQTAATRGDRPVARRGRRNPFTEREHLETGILSQRGELCGIVCADTDDDLERLVALLRQDAVDAELQRGLAIGGNDDGGRRRLVDGHETTVGHRGESGACGGPDRRSGRLC